MRILTIKKFLWPAALILVLAGCNRQTALVPPKIHFGFETCADCGMIINDPQYAAALTWEAPDGSDRTAVFDDIGCLLNWRRHHAGETILAAWVKDARTSTWLDASSAKYVKSRQLQTPMGWGIVAGTKTNDFSALPVQQPMLTWTELLKPNDAEADSTSPETHKTQNN